MDISCFCIPWKICREIQILQHIIYLAESGLIISPLKQLTIKCFFLAQMVYDVSFCLKTNLINLWFFRNLFFFFLNCYLPAPRQTFGHYRGGNLIYLMLISVFSLVWPEGHREPCNEVVSLSLAEDLMRFELRTFWFLSQCLNSLGHSPCI